MKRLELHYTTYLRIVTVLGAIIALLSFICPTDSYSQTEQVSPPDNITGPSEGYVNQQLGFTASGASNNLGHSLEYRFDFGDGTIDDWGNEVHSHTYTSDGHYGVKAQARCSTHTTIVSAWSTVLQGVTIGTDKVDETAPIVFSLAQNYPNPFNPSTSISYTLGASGIVYLDIYNISGQLVRTLVNSYKIQGRYTVVWDGFDEDGKNVSAGLYLYRLSAGTFVQTRKMVLKQ